MKMPLKFWVRLICLAAILCLGVLSAAFPAIFTSDLVAACLKILEVVARLS